MVKSCILKFEDLAILAQELAKVQDVDRSWSNHGRSFALRVELNTTGRERSSKGVKHPQEAMHWRYLSGNDRALVSTRLRSTM